LRILVTGGSGFIGSHIVDELKKKDHTIRVFDTTPPNQNNVEFFKGDLLNDQAVFQACKNVEAVFHLGAIADVGVALSYPKWCLTVNEIGTINVLQAATAQEVERIILASTTWVYGKSASVVNEETPVPLPEHIYTKTKMGQEQLVHAWHEHYGLPYTILRYDIPYGPRMRGNMAIDIFIRKALKKEPITIYGDGNQGRCFIHVEDLARGNVSALQESGKNQVFNLAGKEFVTMNQIVDQIREMYSEIQVVHDLKRAQDFKGVQVSIEKAKKLLGWEPKYSFRDGLKIYTEYLQNSEKHTFVEEHIIR